MSMEEFEETIELPTIREQQQPIENTEGPVYISWFELTSAPVGTIWTAKQECDECTYEGSLTKVAKSETDMHFEFTRTTINNKTNTSVTETKQIVYNLMSKEDEEAFKNMMSDQW